MLVNISKKTKKRTAEQSAVLLKKLFDLCAEGSKRKGCELEALSSERNTDDGDAPEKTGKEEAKGKTESTEDEPNDVCDRMLTKVLVNLFTKGPNNKAREFKALKSERNTDNGNAPEKAEEEVTDCSVKSGK